MGVWSGTPCRKTSATCGKTQKNNTSGKVAVFGRFVGPTSFVHPFFVPFSCVLLCYIPVIEKLTFVFSLYIQSGKRELVCGTLWRALLFKVRQPGTLAPSFRRLSAMGTLKGYSPLVLTARFRLGRKRGRLFNVMTSMESHISMSSNRRKVQTTIRLASCQTSTSSRHFSPESHEE